ncbi:MAG TPA: hypothetical protein VMP12_10490 [Candidatus Sulfotelmatobacter sp.]|nr:hypothetical protein [Candidatus Sulfotelmatobacter sp.]
MGAAAQPNEDDPIKPFLKLLFSFIFVFMVVMTIRTSPPTSLWSAIPSFAALVDGDAP